MIFLSLRVLFDSVANPGRWTQYEVVSDRPHVGACQRARLLLCCGEHPYDALPITVPKLHPMRSQVVLH
jgi:hypothetical protein